MPFCGNFEPFLALMGYFWGQNRVRKYFWVCVCRLTIFVFKVLLYIRSFMKLEFVVGGWGGGFLVITVSHPTFCCVGVGVVVEVGVGL